MDIRTKLGNFRTRHREPHVSLLACGCRWHADSLSCGLGWLSVSVLPTHRTSEAEDRTRDREAGPGIEGIFKLPWPSGKDARLQIRRSSGRIQQTYYSSRKPYDINLRTLQDRICPAVPHEQMTGERPLLTLRARTSGFPHSRRPHVWISA